MNARISGKAFLHETSADDAHANIGHHAPKVLKLPLGGSHSQGASLEHVPPEVHIYFEDVAASNRLTIAHASDSVLAPLDAVLNLFLRLLKITELDALVHFKLAPLRPRRHIALLGVIHRAALGTASI